MHIKAASSCSFVTESGDSQHGLYTWIESTRSIIESCSSNVWGSRAPGHSLAESSHRALVHAKKMHILFEDMVNDSAVA